MADAISNSIQDAKKKKDESDSSSLAKSLNSDMIKAFDSGFSVLVKESEKSATALKDKLEESTKNSKDMLDMMMLSSVATDEFQKAMYKNSNEQVKLLTAISKNTTESKETTNELEQMFGNSPEQQMKLIDAFAEVSKPKGDDAENGTLDKLNTMFENKLAPMLFAQNESLVDNFIKSEEKLAKKAADKAKAEKDKKVDATTKEKGLTAMKPEKGGMFDSFGKAGGAVAGVLGKMGKGLGIGALVAGVVNGITKLWTLELDTNKSLSDQFATAISTFISGLTFGLFKADEIQGTIKKGTDAIGSVINFLTSPFEPFLKAVKQFDTDNIFNSLGKIASGFYNGIVDLFKNMLKGAVSFLPDSMQRGILGFADNLGGALDSLSKRDFEGAKNIGKSAVASLGDAGAGASSFVKSMFTDDEQVMKDKIEEQKRKSFEASLKRRQGRTLGTGGENSVAQAMIDTTPSQISQQINKEKMAIMREGLKSKENQQPVIINNNNTQVTQSEPKMEIPDIGLTLSALGSF